MDIIPFFLSVLKLIPTAIFDSDSLRKQRVKKVGRGAKLKMRIVQLFLHSSIYRKIITQISSNKASSSYFLCPSTIRCMERVAPTCKLIIWKKGFKAVFKTAISRGDDLLSHELLTHAPSRRWNAISDDYRTDLLVRGFLLGLLLGFLTPGVFFELSIFL